MLTQTTRLWSALVCAATLAASAAAQSPSLRCPTPTFDSAATPAEQARFLSIRTALGTTYTAPDSAGGPLGCPSDKATRQPS